MRAFFFYIYLPTFHYLWQSLGVIVRKDILNLNQKNKNFVLFPHISLCPFCFSLFFSSFSFKEEQFFTKITWVRDSNVSLKLKSQLKQVIENLMLNKIKYILWCSHFSLLFQDFLQFLILFFFFFLLLKTIIQLIFSDTIHKEISNT